ncbi:MAG: EAL domain-containing protein [Desulfovibrionaceae bacterium]|nr:EAL domain-containing protein [Desulfovibrionaceae bacterium]
MSRREVLDDTFSAFSMLSEDNLIMLYDVLGNCARFSLGAVRVFNLPGEYIPSGSDFWGNTIVHPEERSRYHKIMNSLFSGKNLSYDMTFRCKVWDGSYTIFRLIGSVIRDRDGAVSLVGGRIVNEGRLEFTDTNTILSNKDALFRDLATILANKKPCSLLMFGINELGAINRNYTYSLGNLVLQQVAWIIQEALGGHGGVYRTEGKRFAVMSTELDEEGMTNLYQRIVNRLRLGITIGEGRQTLSASAGLFLVNDFTLSEPIIYDAVKSAYRDSLYHQDGELVAFNSEKKNEVRANLGVIEEVRRSMINECNHFYIVYQPVVRKKEGDILGFEALLRWEKDGITLPTGTFMPVLLQDFAFEELGIWILRETMQEGLKILRENPNFIIGVNLAVPQIRDTFFLNSLTSLLAQTGFPAKQLCLEFSGQCRTLPFAKIKHCVALLNEMGVRVCFDDFGTGYSSLELLQELKVNLVKFDSSLLNKSLSSKVARSDLVLLSRVALSHETFVCFKGVENEFMERIVNELPCTCYQGYSVARPMRLAELLSYIRTVQ